MSTILGSSSVSVHSAAPVESTSALIPVVLPQIPPRRSGLVNIFVRIQNHRSCKIYSLRKVPNGFRLSSAFDDDRSIYRVTHQQGCAYCNCPDFTKRFTTHLESPCKHILALTALADDGIIAFGEPDGADEDDTDEITDVGDCPF